jgi:hypothetical protein
MVQDVELRLVQALASTITASFPADSLEAAKEATSQMLESARGKRSDSDAVHDGCAYQNTVASMPTGQSNSCADPVQVIISFAQDCQQCASASTTATVHVLSP